MLHFRSPLVLLAVLLVLTARPIAAADEEPSLGAPFESAIAEIGKQCEKAEAKSLLVIVRSEEGLEDVPEGLVDTLFEALQSGLAEAAAELEVTRCPLDGDSPLESEAKRVLTTRELRDLAEDHEFDAALDATYRVSRGKPSFRLALFEDQRRLFLNHVPLGEESVKQAVAQHESRAPRTATAPAATIRPGGRPPAAGVPRPTAGLPRPNSAASIAAANPAGMPIRPGKGGRAVAPPGTIGDGDNEGAADGPQPGDLPGDIPAGDATGLNKRVLDFAQQSFGQQVGNGECWTLANEALKAAGARPANGYTFGRGIDRKAATAGDILQFKSVRLERGNRYWTLGTPHHTAVVEGVDGNVVTVLHQNFGTRTVTRFTFDFADMVSGEVHAFRPRP